METTVVNIKHDKCDVLICRPSIFGNPFVIGRDGTRKEVIEKYVDYFAYRLAMDKKFKAEVLALKGKILGCHCEPLDCHGHVIAVYLNKLV